MRHRAQEAENGVGDRDARLIAGAVGVSALGDFVLWVSLTLHLQAAHGSGLAVAAMFIALWGPVAVLAPVAGLVVDRNEARTVLVVASLIQALLAAALALLLDSVAAILALAALLGTANAISQPAEFALVPAIAGERGTRRLSALNGSVETARYTGMTAGPLVGGVLAGAGGTEAALLVDAASFALVAVAGLALGARRPATIRSGASGDRARALDGIAHLWGDRVLAIVVGAAFVSLLFMTASATAEVFFLTEDLGVDGLVYGLVFSAWTVGMAAGALLLSPRVPVRSLVVVALAMIAVQGIGLGLPAAWLAVPFGAAMWFVGGIGHGTKNVLIRTLIQERVPDAAHGRAFAAYNGLRNGAELVALAAGGALVLLIGARGTLALAGGIPVLAALGALALYRGSARWSGVAGAADPLTASR